MLSLSVAVLSSRETPAQLLATLEAVLAAVRVAGGSAHVDLVVNGNRALADAMVNSLRESPLALPTACRVGVCWVAMGDKATAFNHSLHLLAPEAALQVFVDGYAQPAPGAFVALRDALQSQPQALAVSGLPTVGWSAARLAAEMRRDGGIHGNLFALSAATVVQLKALGLRLPKGIYRTDPTLAAALAFGLDLHPRQWAPRQRIALAEGAQWRIPALRWWLPSDLRTYWRRRQRQALGVLENAAVRDSYQVRQRGFADLPATSRELVQRWIEESPVEARALLAQPALARAWQALQVPRDWHAADEAPQRLA